MTVLTDMPASTRTSSSALTLLPSFPLMLTLAFLAVVLPKLGLAVAVWTTNAFVDTDDAMRMVQVRDFLAGQGWFDLVAYRLDPPVGSSMHWSRLIDLPLASFIRLIEPLAGQDAAERIVRIVWPLSFFMALLALIISTARRLAGPMATAPAAFLAACSSWVSMQFFPGRIDHHTVEIVLMTVMLRLGLEAVLPDSRSWRAAIGAALAAAVAMQISLEDFPFVAALLTSLGVIWIADCEGMRRVLMAFGLTLASAALALFVATTPAARYTVVSCDAYSLPHLTALGLTSLTFVVLAAATPLLPERSMRLTAGAGATAVAAALMVLLFSACMGDPLVAVDPLVRHFWLDRVNEAQSMLAFFGKDWPAATATSALLAVTAVAMVFAVRTAPADRLAGWVMIAIFFAIGVVGSLWQIRVLPPTSVTVVLAGVPAVLAAAYAPAASPRRRTVRVAIVLALLCPLTWVALVKLMPGGRPDVEAQDKAWKSCTAAAELAPLNALAPGLVLAPIDLGAHILAYTSMSVLSAPYHRNNDGNGAAIAALNGWDDTAREIIASRGVHYVVLCPTMPESQLYINENADGLAARLMRGQVPPWLKTLPMPSGPLVVFRVVKTS